VKHNHRTIIVPLGIILSVWIGIGLSVPAETPGQLKRPFDPSQRISRDPFLLPSGVRLLSEVKASTVNKDGTLMPNGRPIEPLPPPLTVKAILINRNVRLALVDRHIVTPGDRIGEETILEIKKDRVLLGKGGQKRTLFLPQSPVLLKVEEKLKGE
jgi:hypothetical protein